MVDEQGPVSVAQFQKRNCCFFSATYYPRNGAAPCRRAPRFAYCPAIRLPLTSYTAASRCTMALVAFGSAALAARVTR
jgi:hypothetical protein